MSARYRFYLKSEDRRLSLPERIIIGQKDTETTANVMLKMLAFVMFHSDRLLVEPRLHDANIPFDPDLVALDYEMRPKLWVECGECGVNKLDKLAVKVPEAKIWVVKPSFADAEGLIQAMAKAGLRRNRYDVIGLDSEVFDEACSLLEDRNELVWFSGSFDPPGMRFDFNGLWFEASFAWLKF